jgi:hypothetical protein
MADENLIHIAHAQLVGLQGNIPDNTAGGEFIDLLHSIIDDLENLGADLSKFRIPEDAIATPRSANASWCDSHFLRAKVDGLLVLFSVSGDKKQIGFMAN